VSSETEKLESNFGKVVELDYRLISHLDATIDSFEKQNAYSEILECNPNKIQGSVGEYLIALRPEMTLNEAEKAQEKLEQKKLDSFAIVDDDGEILSAKSGMKELLPISRFNVSNEFVFAKKFDLQKLPESHKRLLFNQKFSVELHKDIWSYDQMHKTSFATEAVQGYSADYTGENIDVFFDKNTNVLVALEYFKPKNLNKIISTGFVYNASARFIHEFGHAYSKARGYDVELNQQVMNKFELIRVNVLNSPDTHKALEYFSQAPILNSQKKFAEHPGLREVIAEIYASNFGGSSLTPHAARSLAEVFMPIKQVMNDKGYFK